MRRFILAALFGFLALPAFADSEKIHGTISAQLEAFQQDDFAKAFEFASPSIRNIFGTSERFGQMVRGGYPMVWRPDHVLFLELRDVAGQQVQKMLITGPDGRSHLLDYYMVETPDGWLINGVSLLPAPPPSV